MRIFTLEFIACLKLSTISFEKSWTSRGSVEYAYLEAFKKQEAEFLVCCFWDTGRIKILQKGLR